MLNNVIVSRSAAHREKTRHQYVPGIGYIRHSGPPELDASHTGTASCAPPARTPDGSHHMLRPAAGHPPKEMTWVAAEHAWEPFPQVGKGHRLAFTVAHLSKAGWAYIGPADQV